MDREAFRKSRSETKVGRDSESGNLFATLSGIVSSIYIPIKIVYYNTHFYFFIIFILAPPSVSSGHGWYLVHSFLGSASLLSYAEVWTGDAFLSRALF